MVTMTGALLVYTGIRDVPMVDALRAFAGGLPPTPPGPRTTSVNFTGISFGAAAGAAGAPGGDAAAPPTSGTTTATAAGAHPEIAAAARKYIGVRYLWGGTDPAKGLDCSGLVKVAIRDATGDTSCPRTSTGQSAWSRFSKVSRADVQAGDVCWWPGHVVVADGPDLCISAPRPGLSVRVERIDSAGPVGTGAPRLCLRYNGGAQAAAPAVKKRVLVA